MENFGMTPVVVITIIAYLIGEAVKLMPFIKNNWIPAICGAVGAVLGAAAMHLMPEYPAQDYLTAVAVGIISGLAATGANQVYKQVYPAEDDEA